MALTATVKELQDLFADLYALYLKTQVYHWTITGPNFNSLHQLLEIQYKQLELHIDNIAERIIILGEKPPYTFNAIANIAGVSDPDPSFDWQKMLTDLVVDQSKILAKLRSSLVAATKDADDGTIELLSDYLLTYDKNRWILENHLK